MLQRVCLWLIGTIWTPMSRPAYATAVPVWSDPATYAFSFTGSIGGGDIDRVTAQAHPAFLSGLQPGREWFAWVDADASGVVMSSWQGFDLPADAFTGFLALDEFSSPLSPLAPAMNGFVQPDGGVYICISGQGDTDCNRSPGNSPSIDYSFFIAFAPLEVPEPDNAFVAASGALLSLALSSQWWRARDRPRRRRLGGLAAAVEVSGSD